MNLNNYLESINDIFTSLSCDRRLLLSLLGNHNQVTTFNIKLFLSTLENGLNSVLSHLYHIESKAGIEQAKQFVRVVPRQQTTPVQVSQLIRKQQCSECAEREGVNRFDDSIIHPYRTQETRERLQEMVSSPEMQYRLHSLSQCRLPRSRLLVNERYK